MRRVILSAAYALTTAAGLAAVPGCGSGSPTGAPPAPSVSKNFKGPGDNGKTVVDEAPPPPVRSK